MEKEVFILGERKYVSYEVKARDSKADFTIRNCTYQLIKNGTVEAEGIGEIDGHLLHVMIEPLTAYKFYVLVVSYSIANQELKELTLIEVIAP